MGCSSHPIRYSVMVSIYLLCSRTGTRWLGTCNPLGAFCRKPCFRPYRSLHAICRPFHSKTKEKKIKDCQGFLSPPHLVLGWAFFWIKDNGKYYIIEDDIEIVSSRLYLKKRDLPENPDECCINTVLIMWILGKHN